MDLSAFGWDGDFERKFQKFKEEDFLPARVVESNRLAYTLFSDVGEILGKLSGNYRIKCQSNGDYPTVGDWIIFKPRTNTRFVSIQGMLERKSKFSRKVSGRGLGEQVIAANIDTIFIVSGLDQEFNVRRLERYVVLAAESNAEFVFILNKADLCKDADDIIAKTKSLFPNIHIFQVSALDNQGLDQLKQYIQYGKTIVFLGSSGVGKSTIINCLLGEERQKTGHLSNHNGRGRHITSSKNLILLPSGGLVIDTPGLREIQMLASGEGLGSAFSDIEQLSKNCKYKNCKHIDVAGCAVLAAVSDGTLSEKRLRSYHKLKREIEYNNSRIDVKSKNKKNKFWRTVTKQRKQMQKKQKKQYIVYPNLDSNIH